MKRVIRIVLVLLICLSVKTVYAENYKIKELIPYDVDTTIHTDNFSYKGIHFDKKGIHFNGIKNLTNEKLPISISVGLFNKKGVNIGTINYCDLSLEGKDEMSFIIKYDDCLGKNYKVNDIKYIAVLGDNINCRTKGSTDYIGQSVDKLGIIHKDKFDNQTELCLTILSIVAGVILVLVVYKIIFTRAYRNVDGNEVREAFDDINKELKEMREEREKENVEVLEEVPNKPPEILEQEEETKKEDKQGTDLHNLYK